MKQSPKNKAPTADLIGDSPDIETLVQNAVESPRLRSWALAGLLLMVVLGALHLARALVLPILLAIILSLVFAPLVRGMKKLRIPESLSAALIVTSLITAVSLAGYNLAAPATKWLEKAPDVIRKIDVRLRPIAVRVMDVSDATEQVKRITSDMTSGSKKPVQEVRVKTPGTTGVMLDILQNFALSTLSMLMLLYMLLASSDHFLQKLISVTPRLDDKKRAEEISLQIESEMSTYLFTVTMINTGLGCSVALAMYFLGVPNPILWGVMAGLFNFVPYLGDIASLAVLTIVGLLTFDTWWLSLLVPSVFYVLTAVEGYLLTPLIVGNRLSLNPVVIIVSVLFWGWMWGLMGAFLAVPILVMIKTISERVKGLQSIGKFLSA